MRIIGTGRLVASIAATALLALATAGAANAAPAHWVTPGFMTWLGSLTVQPSGAGAVVCPTFRITAGIGPGGLNINSTGSEHVQPWRQDRHRRPGDR